MLDSECVLVQFVSDQSVAVGFFSWLKSFINKKINDLDISIRDKEIVTINWPKNVNIQCARIMIKNISTIELESYPVQVLAYGGENFFIYILKS